MSATAGSRGVRNAERHGTQQDGLAGRHACQQSSLFFGGKNETFYWVHSPIPRVVNSHLYSENSLAHLGEFTRALVNSLGCRLLQMLSLSSKLVVQHVEARIYLA